MGSRGLKLASIPADLELSMAISMIKTHAGCTTRLDGSELFVKVKTDKQVEEVRLKMKGFGIEFDDKVLEWTEVVGQKK